MTNKPDLNAPRYRKTIDGTLNTDFIKLLKEKVPLSANLSNIEIKNIIKKFNENIWKSVIEKRDGVELPELIGHIFIGTCPPSKKKNIDFKASEEYLQVVQHRNFESDQFLAKIFFTNFGSKYRFKNHELWAFDATREFSRTVSATYPENWKKYLQIDPKVKISNIYKSNTYRLDKKDSELEQLKNYDEFDL